MIGTRLAFAFSTLILAVGCETDAPAALSMVAGADSLAANLASGPNGALIMSWLERDGETAHLKYSELRDDDWSAPTTLASGDDWFVNWADFPSVVPVSDSLWAAHWLQKSRPGTYAYDVMLSVSPDAGQRWSDPVSPHTDDTPTEHGFVSLYPLGGAVGVLWLDGRDTVDGRSPMTLRSASVDAAGKVAHKRLVDSSVCDCCQTDVAIAASGPVAVYRDRSDRDVRDISVARFIDGQWSDGTAVADDGWTISGCPVNGPAIAAHGEHVAVAWFTAADKNPRVRLARSSDSGQQFGEPVTLGSGEAIGRVGLLLLDDGRVLLSWLRKRNDGQADVVVTTISSRNAIGATTVVATTAAGSLSGVPQIARQGKTVVVAWTAKQNERRQVMTKAIALDELL